MRDAFPGFALTIGEFSSSLSRPSSPNPATNIEDYFFFLLIYAGFAFLALCT